MKDRNEVREVCRNIIFTVLWGTAKPICQRKKKKFQQQKAKKKRKKIKSVLGVL